MKTPQAVNYFILPNADGVRNPVDLIALCRTCSQVDNILGNFQQPIGEGKPLLKCARCETRNPLALEDEPCVKCLACSVVVGGASLEKDGLFYDVCECLYCGTVWLWAPRQVVVNAITYIIKSSDLPTEIRTARDDR